jgi:DNA-binding CsgD family transcriptional regulator
VFDGESRPFDFGVLSFSRDVPLTMIEQQHHEPRVQMFATYFHSVAPPLLLEKKDTRIPAMSPKLTAREYDCLSWAANGKSNWDVSRILNISVPTVAFHLKNAARKLDVSGRTAAIARAIRLKLIDPL